jgi:4-hydroxyphenylpyruvate dioxygenase
VSRRDRPKEEYVQTAIATVCLGGTLDEKLEAIAAARFNRVEIFEPDLLSFGGTPRDVRRMMDGLGLQAAVFQPFRDFEGMPEPQRSKVFARVERKFDVMQELGCDFLMICSNVSPDAVGGIDRASADLHQIGEHAARRGLRIGFEALSWGRHINDYRDAWEAVRRADHPNVGLVLDSFHILARKTDLGTIRSIPGDRIFLVQLADAPLLELDYLNWSRHYRSFPGQGDLPIAAFMDALQATGFNGLLSLEIFSDRFRAGSARSLAIDGQRSLLFMLDEYHKRNSVASSAAFLPPRSRCEGIQFLEFALDEQSRPGFEKMLAGMGFSKVGAHRSKSVGRWRQGDINVVVNAETEGFAHSYNLMHGSAVCAMALRVENAQTTMDRALALLDQPFHQQVGPGEMSIPAVRGLGGSLIYFVDKSIGFDHLWEVDFEAVAARGSGADAGLQTIDHVQHAMRYEEMLTWVLFYTSLLETAKTPVVEVVDPGGVTHSQAVESEDGHIRLALNASLSQHTMASRFLSEFFGSGVHHVAFATNDILATAARFRENGIDLLPIPENYYDDLEVRADLSAEQIRTLKQNNILYDSDAHGAYFQLYTRTLLPNGFFLEIVERRGGYRGYGAVNAPVRLAAQTVLTPPYVP